MDMGYTKTSPMAPSPDQEEVYKLCWSCFVCFSSLGSLKQLWSCCIEFTEMFGAGPLVTPHVYLELWVTSQLSNRTLSEVSS